MLNSILQTDGDDVDVEDVDVDLCIELDNCLASIRAIDYIKLTSEECNRFMLDKSLSLMPNVYIVVSGGGLHGVKIWILSFEKNNFYCENIAEYYHKTNDFTQRILSIQITRIQESLVLFCGDTNGQIIMLSLQENVLFWRTTKTNNETNKVKKSLVELKTSVVEVNDKVILSKTQKKKQKMRESLRKAKRMKTTKSTTTKEFQRDNYQKRYILKQICENEIKLQSSPILSLLFCSERNLLISGNSSGILSIYKVDKTQQVLLKYQKQLHCAGINDLSYTILNGDVIIGTAGDDESISLLKVTKEFNETNCPFEWKNYTKLFHSSVKSISFSEDKLYAISSDQRLKQFKVGCILCLIEEESNFLDCYDCQSLDINEEHCVVVGSGFNILKL